MQRLFLYTGFLLAVLVLAVPVQAQLYPGVSGLDLRDAIRADFYPAQTLGYDRARDTLFLHVDLEAGDSLRDVYAGYAVHLDTSADPTTDAFQKGINTEHTFPQSMGADEEPMRSDMHHLFPVRDNVNSSRGNHPYDEIPDELTDAWYYRDLSRSTPPETDIDLWSEKDNDHPNATYDGRFEPRERHKGDAARAVFYFAAVYPEAANQVFFDVQKDVLLQWHYQDPADSLERARSEAIARYQGNENPFVLDSTLARRAFFEEGGGGNGEGGVPAYTFDENSTCPTQDDGATGEGASLLSDFTRVGVDCAPTQGVFNSTGWPAEKGEEKYVGFSVSQIVDAEVVFEEATLTFTVRRSGTGPSEGALLYRIGQMGGFTTLLEWTLEGTDTHTFTASVPDTATGQGVEFRFYGWGASSTQGTLRFDDVALSMKVTATAAENAVELPATFRLLSAYPNPFNPRTTIVLDVDKPQPIELAVFGPLGQRVAVLCNEYLAAGRHEFPWAGEGLASGVYFVRARGETESKVRRVVLFK